MRSILAILALFIAFAAQAEQSSGEKFKSDAKAAVRGVKDAAVTVGKQVGTSTKKAYKSTKDKIKGDVHAGKPGNGSLRKQQENMPVAKSGRESN